MTVLLSQTEFDALPDYSFSNPTGVIIGKKWKRRIKDGWVLCEYAYSDDKDTALIRIEDIVIIEEQRMKYIIDKIMKNPETCIVIILGSTLFVIAVGIMTLLIISALK